MTTNPQPQSINSNGTLYMSLELAAKNWKLGLADCLGRNVRVRTIAAGDFERLKEEVAIAKKRFDLDVDGASRAGLLLIEMGEPCATLTYSAFVIDDGTVSTTIEGTNTVCPEGLSGTLDIAVNAAGIPRFLVEMVLFQGVPTILVLNPSTSNPLYSCSFNPVGETVECHSYGEN